MILRRLRVAGFRGFNSEREILFSERITVVGAPNSYGKTSISEAMEFLLYGSTSKVDHGDYSKEEYRGCYRNVHFPPETAAWIEATFGLAGDRETVLKVELDVDGAIRRFEDRHLVERWSFADLLASAARPFVLQHALKDLLLVPPAERFQRFASLVGLTDVESCVQALVDLCTKPRATIQPEASERLDQLQALRDQLSLHATLKKALSAMKKGSGAANTFFTAVEDRGDALIGAREPESDRVRRLVEARERANSRVYEGGVGIRSLTDADRESLESAKKKLQSSLTGTFLDDYGRVSAATVVEDLRRRACFLEIGEALLAENASECPLCAQPVAEGFRDHLAERHAAISAQLARGALSGEIKARVQEVLRSLHRQLERHLELLLGQVSDLLSATVPPNDVKVQAVFGDANVASLGTIRDAADTMRPKAQALGAAGVRAESAIAACETALTSGTPNLSQPEETGRALEAYLTCAAEFIAGVREAQATLAAPTEIFRQSLAELAGTAELSLVIGILEQRDQIGRALRLEDVIGGLRALRGHVQQGLGEIMNAVINTDLTESVMRWYAKIRTLGDPDVHFSGFALPKTKTGDFKARTIAVGAKSYGVDLPSAVSSLSESKLNALGLCVSIASTLRAPGPLGFLIIDDPIQSWDDEHEDQFVAVLRALVEAEGRQVIVLSHKTSWAKQVCAGCRSLNGVHYELTGYRKDGPVVAEREWCAIDHRIGEAESIAADAGATSDRLQQGEEELRLAACQLAARIARDKLSRVTSPHNMNASGVRAILNQAGAAPQLLDRVGQMFVAADDAHHAPKNYQPSAERIRRGCATLREAKRILEEQDRPPARRS